MVQQSKCSGTPLIPEALGDAPRPRMAIQQVPSTRPCPSQLLALVFKSCKLFVCCLPVLQNILWAASEKFTCFGSLNCCPCVFLCFLVLLPKHVNFLAATCPAFGSSPSQNEMKVYMSCPLVCCVATLVREGFHQEFCMWERLP